VVQNADLFLSAPYFSPDGDGQRDDTTLTWRAAAPARVVVSNGLGRKVRTLAEAAPDEGTVTWDGRDDNGRLVPDGSYFITLRASQGQTLGRVMATVDTNRLPIHEAAGTGRL